MKYLIFYFKLWIRIFKPIPTSVRVAWKSFLCLKLTVWKYQNLGSSAINAHRKNRPTLIFLLIFLLIISKLHHSIHTPRLLSNDLPQEQDLGSSEKYTRFMEEIKTIIMILRDTDKLTIPEFNPLLIVDVNAMDTNPGICFYMIWLI